jgi:hypothetical protein
VSRQTQIMELDQIGVDYWLRPIPPEDMPMLAASLLADGHDSPALRQTAGFPATDDPRDIRSAFCAALGELGAWLPDMAAAQIRVGVAAAKDLVAGRVSIQECARRVCDVWEFDDVIYHALPDDIDELVAMCWVFPGDEYDANGGDDRLLSAARTVASRAQ